MTPTLLGRIQTRIALLATVGVVWTLLLVPLLPQGTMADLAEMYRAAFVALGATAVIGAVIWEPIYHLFQQHRWEKDWPIIFGFFQGLPEAVGVFFATSALVGRVPLPLFALHFATTWIVVWLVANGPMRVVSLRWRYRGGRLL